MAGNNETSIVISAIDNTEAALNSVKGNVGAVTGQFERLGGVVSGFAALAGVTAFAGIIKGSIDSAAGLKDLSEQSGASVESLSAIKGVAKGAGVEMEAVGGGLQKLSKNMLEATSGGGDAAKVFSAMGISVRDSSGNLKSSDAVMMEFAKTLQGVSSGTEKAALAQVVFGKSGAQLLPMLNDLAEIGELQAKVTTEQAAQADEFGKTLLKLEAINKSWVTTVAMEVLPAANAFASTMFEMANSANGVKKGAQELAADGSIQSWSKSAAMGVARVVDVAQVAASTFTQFRQSLAVVMKDVETFAKVAAIGIGAGFTQEGQAAIKQALKERSDFVKVANEDLQKWWNPELFSDKLAKKFDETGAAAKTAAPATRSYADALKKVKEESDKAAAALAALRLDQMALLHKQAAAELDAMAKSQEEWLKHVDALVGPLEKQADELERQIEFYGMTDSAIQQTIVARKEEQLEMLRGQTGMESLIETLEREIEARKRIASAASQKEYLDANEKASKEAARQWENFARDIEQSLTDSLYRAFESGQSFGEAFVNSLKNTLKTTVLKVAVQAVIGGTGSLVNAGLNALVGTSGSNGGAGNNYLGMANNASSLYNLWGAAAALGGGTVGASSASLLYANAVGAVGGDSLGALIAANGGWSGVSTAAAGSTAAGGAGAGTGSAAGAAASMWPLAIVAGMYMSSKLYDSGYKFEGDTVKADDPKTWSLLAQAGMYNEANMVGKLFGQDNFGDSKLWQVLSGANLSRYVDEYVQKALGIRGGGPKMEAFGGDRTVSWGLAQTAPGNEVLSGIAAGLETQFNSILETFGKSAQDIMVGLGMDADPNGDAGARTGYALKVGDQSIFSERGVDSLTMEAITNNANRALIAALQAVDISQPVNAYLDSLGDVGKLTKDQISTALGMIDTYHGLNKAMDDLNLGADSLTTGLINAFGGVEGLQSALETYYQNYYTAEEQRARTIGQITTVLDAAGASFSEAQLGAMNRADFRSWIEGIDQTTDAGKALFAAALKVSGAFASVAQAMDNATSSLSSNIASLQSSWSVMGQTASGGDLSSMLSMLETGYGYLTDIADQSDVLGQIGDLQSKVNATNIDALQKQLDSARSLLDAAKGIKGYLDSLKLSDLSTFSPEQKLAESASQYSIALAQAKAGDATAAGNLQGLADSYLGSARDYYGSNTQYASIFDSVTSGLSQFADAAIAANDPLVESLTNHLDALSGTSAATLTATRDLYSQAASQFQSNLKAITDQVIATDSVKSAVDQLPPALAGILSSSVAASIAPLLAATTAAQHLTVGADGQSMIAKAIGTGSLSVGASSMALQVESLYETMAGRVADASGLEYWTKRASEEGGISSIMDAFRSGLFASGEIPKFATGGDHFGGLRLVGERGPELEVTGPARIFNARQTQQILAGGAPQPQTYPALEALVRDLVIEVKNLRDDKARADRSKLDHAADTNRKLSRIESTGVLERAR